MNRRITATVMAAGLALAGAAVTTGASMPVSAAARPSPVAGNWKVTYGAPAVVRMKRSGRTYTEIAKTRVRVVGSDCYLRAGTVIATFHSTGRWTYSGRHGLWYTSNCSFAYWTGLKLVRSHNGRRLTATLAGGNARTIRFTRIGN